MDLPLHLNAKYYGISDAVFHILFFTSLSLLSCSTSLPHSPRDAWDYDYHTTIRGHAKEISISSYAPWGTDSAEFADFGCAKQQFFSS